MTGPADHPPGAPGSDPVADRPDMAAYGVLPAGEGTGLLPWSWAHERLTRSHDYWVATHWPDGRPHLTPVWGVWDGDALWFSCAARSRKARNLAADPRCSAATDHAQEPVVIDGVAELVTDRERVAAYLRAAGAKYAIDYGDEFLDPAATATVRLAPVTAIGLVEADFTGSPTRWRF